LTNIRLGRKWLAVMALALASSVNNYCKKIISNRLAVNFNVLKSKKEKKDFGFHNFVFYVSFMFCLHVSSNLWPINISLVRKKVRKGREEERKRRQEVRKMREEGRKMIEEERKMIEEERKMIKER